MRFEKIGPLGLWNLFRDDWIVTRRAARLFFASTVLTLALTPVFLGRIDTNTMPLWERLPWGVLGVLGPIGLFFLWLGMWRYWARIDKSTKCARRFWFLILLFGFWHGSCFYYLLVYVPQYFRRTNLNGPRAEGAIGRPSGDVVFTPGVFGSILIAGWVLLFAGSFLLFLFPKVALILGPRSIWIFSLLVVPGTMVYGIVWLYRLGMKRP